MSQTEYVRQRQNSKKKFLKIGRLSSRSLKYAECCHFRLLFCNERQGNEQRIITRAYTVIVLVAAAVKVCLLNSLEPSKRQNNEQPKKKKPKESPADQNDCQECRKYIFNKTSFENQNINDIPAISCQVVSRKWSVLCTHSVSNVRR